MDDRRKGIIYASVAALMWGFLAIVLKFTVMDLPPVDVAWFRFSLAFIVLSLYYVFFERSAFRILVKPPIKLIVAALFLGLNYYGFITGIHYTTPSIAQVFIQIGPLLLALSGFILFKEKATLLQIAGLLLVVTGFAFFYKEQLIALGTSNGNFNKGIIWIIIGATAWAAYAIIQKKLVQQYHPMHLNLVLFGVPALLFLPATHLIMFTGLDWIQWAALIFLGFNTLIAYGSIAMALKYLEANRVSVISTCNPIITFIVMGILGYLDVSWMIKELYTPVTILGALLVLAGTIMANVFASNKAN